MGRIFAIAVFLLLHAASFAQSKKAESQFIRHIAVEVDGDLSEWEAYLQPIDSNESFWSYAIGYDSEHLYIAVKVLDQALQQEAAVHGISVSINTAGKKKADATLLFPVPDGETLRAIAGQKNLSSRDLRQQLLSRSRGLGVIGFPRMIDGLIAANNEYGVKVVVAIDDADHLMYESRIPLAQLKKSLGDRPIAIRLTIENRWAHFKKASARNPVSPAPHAVRNAASSSVVKSPFKGKTEIWVVDQLPVK